MNFLKEDSDSVRVTTKAPSVEPTPRSRDECNGTFELPGSSVEQGSPQRADNTADPLTNIIAVATDLANSQTSDPVVIASGPTVQTGGGRNHAEQPRQDAVVEAEVRSVPLPADDDDDGRLPVEPSCEPSNLVQTDITSDSREAVPTVAMSSASGSVPVAVAKPIAQSTIVIAVDDDPPELVAENPPVGKQPSRRASANIATSATESVDQHETDNLAPLSATEDKVIDTETRAQLDPNWATPVADGVEEDKAIPELAEIPTPAPEHVPLVEETPPGVYVDAYGRAGASQVPVVELKAIQDTDSQPVTAELQATLGAQDVTRPVEVSPVEIIPDNDSSAPFVPAEAEHAADQVSELTIAKPQSCEAAEALRADVSAGIVSAAQVSLLTQDEVEAHAAPESFVSEAHVLETRDMGAPTPAQENTALVDETPGPEIALEECEPDSGPPAIASESEAVENKAAASVVLTMPTPEALTPILLAEEAQPCIEAELPTQALAEPLSSGSDVERATAALATVDEMTAAKVEAQPTLDSPTDPETHSTAPESASIDDTLEIAGENPAGAVTAPEPVKDKATVWVIDDGQVLVEDDDHDAAAAAATAASASEPTVDTLTLIIDIKEPIRGQDVGFTEVSSAPAPQSADQAASHAASEEPQVDIAEWASPGPEVGTPDHRDTVDAGELECVVAELEEPVSVPGPVVQEPQAAVEAREHFPDVDGVPKEAQVVTAAPAVDAPQGVDVRAEQRVTCK